jgi:hypothetical protein
VKFETPENLKKKIKKTMSGTAKFRSRKLDFKRLLPVHREWQLIDLDKELSQNRTAIVETGVEKEEEEVIYRVLFAFFYSSLGTSLETTDYFHFTVWNLYSYS